MDQLANVTTSVNVSRLNRRNFIKGALGAVAVAAVSSKAISSASASTGTAHPYITTTAVNLRKSPSSSSKILKVVSEGTVVIDYDLVIQNGYRSVDCNGTVGWIYDDYLVVESEEEGPITFTTTTAVNLRKSSNSSSKIIKVVPAGAQVIDYDLVIENGYRGVDYNGTVGWIYDDYLTQ
ncbi:hypothetical protein BH09CHL1_BH09CHL1_00750 [soil metagenome]